MSAFVRSAVARHALAFLAVMFVLAGGYHLTYQLFFLELPIEDIARTAEGGQPEDFRYDGVVYFEGVRLRQMESRTLRYEVPRIIAASRGKEVEFFVRMDSVEEDVATTRPGRLRITQGRGGKTHVIDLEAKKLQRVRIPWEPAKRRTNTLQVRFQASSPDGIDDRTVESIVLATNIRGVRLWPQAALLGLFGCVAFAGAVRLRGGVNGVALLIIMVPLLVMAWLHSGAIISNECFDGHRKIEGMSAQTGILLDSGHFGPRMYRSTGFALVPLATAAVEGGTHAFNSGFARIYPTSRYVMFVWTALSLAALLLVLHRRLGGPVALIAGLLYATHYPFIADLYAPDADANFIPLMTLLAACFIAHCYPLRNGWMALAGVGLAFFLMISTKITPLFLLPLLPAACWARTLVTQRTWRDRRAALLLAVMLASALGGKYTASAFDHPERNVGIEGEPFQKHVFWHMIWASYGNYDHHSAHGFTRSGGLRNERVAAATGLPVTTYLRQSQTATEQVYKPDVLNALRERPGFFYSTAHLRLYLDGLRFRRYTFGERGFWTPWLKDGFRGEEVISGEEVYGLTPERRLIRYGRMWKISPLMFLTKMTQGHLTLMMDVTLIAAALLGIALIRRVDLMVMLFGVAAAHFTFNMWIHAMNRYMDFADVVLIIGLAVFIAALLSALAEGARRSVKPPPAPQPQGKLV